MQISFADRESVFRPWRPSDGQMFTTIYAFDSETTLIDTMNPWITPAYVLGAAYDGERGYFITREQVESFFIAHQNVPVAMHHAAFDLNVLHVLAPDLNIYLQVERNLVWDTQLLHKLCTLGDEGHTASGKGQSTLEHCVECYLGIKLPKDVKDDEGRDVRRSYGRWLGLAPQTIPPVYLEYLAKDTMATLFVFLRLWERIHSLLQHSQNVWGFVSSAWLKEQVDRWGPQTHHIQLKASIVLQAISNNGLRVDLQRREELLRHLDDVIDDLGSTLRHYGYMPGKGSRKAIQEILRQLERQHPGITFPRTPEGSYQTSQEALEELAAVEVFIKTLLQFEQTKRLKSSFVNKMGRSRLHPRFHPLMVSGRTSSSGEINAQNLPCDERVRSCFVPSDGQIFMVLGHFWGGL